MSDSSLSDVPIGVDDIGLDEVNEPTLPTLLPSLYLQPPRTMLPPSSSPLFAKNLYMRTLLDTTPPTIRVTCSQPDCGYSPQPLVFSDKSTGNLWKHYTQKHPQISFSMRKNDQVQAASSPSSSSSFFELKKTTAKQPVNASKYRDLLLQFVVSNNLSLRLVDSLSFRQIIQFLSPITLSVSARTLHRDLQRRFSLCRAQLQAELHSHIANGGRICLTTDSWSARNYTEYSAVTAHWINSKWQQKSNLLDVIHLKEPIHSGEYLASQLYAVTDDMGITDAIFTCTRDNASANTVMLAEYELLARNHSTSIQQPWTFTVKEGDVRCIAHIINIAVQHALKTIKADPSAEAETYRCELGAARIPRTVDSHTEVMNTLAKLRRHIYVFRNRRLWKDALQKQTMVAGLKVQQLSLDMPVRWNSTHKMLESAIKLQVPITAICASQQWDISMRDIALNANDWSTIKELELFFVIFLRPSQKLQASTYPTLNYAIPQYLKMINKLNHMLKEVGEQSTIGIACNAALYKLNEYYTLTANQQYSHLSVATICDPRMNLEVFTSLWPSSREASKRNRVRAHFQDVFTQYKTRQYHLDTERIEQQTELANAAAHETDSDDDLYATEGISFQEPEWKRWILELRPGQ